MKTKFLSLILILTFHHFSFAQYVADFGKYLKDSINNANLLKDDEAEQLAVDIKNAETNEEYVYVIGRSDAKNSSEILCDPKPFYYGSGDGTLSKYDKCGNLIWFRFIGTDLDSLPGSECGDFALCIALDKDSTSNMTNIYIAGYSYNNHDFFNCPDCSDCDSVNSIKAFSCSSSPCVFQSQKNSDFESFIAKYDEEGNLLKWTYFGGDGGEYIFAIDVFEHNVFITGVTTSGFEFIPSQTLTFDSTKSGEQDAFIAQFDDELCSLNFFSYIGGPGDDRGHDVKVFKTNGVTPQTGLYVSGTTSADMGDSTYLSLNSFKGGINDAFLSQWKLNMVTNAFEPQWLEYVGGKGEDRGRELIVADSTNNVIIAGFTNSNDFIKSTIWSYSKSKFYSKNYQGKKDAFVAKFDALGIPLWGTYFGGSGEDIARGLVRYSIAIGDSTANYIAIAGGTKSKNLLTMNSPINPPFQSILNGNSDTMKRDAFIAILTDPPASGIKQELDFASYFGGSNKEWDDIFFHYGPDLALGGSNELYLTFYTKSKNIENYITSGGFHHNSKTKGDYDGFLSKIINSNITNQFDCTDFDWDTNNPERSAVWNTPEDEMELYPNPTGGNFNVHLKMKGTISEEATIEILNVYGQKVYTENFSIDDGELNAQISLNRLLTQGAYFVRVTVSDIPYFEQLIFQK